MRSYSEGRIFLDVNSDCFQAIVDYMNELAISSEDELPAPPMVEDELHQVLAHQMKRFGLSVAPQIDSNILNERSDMATLHNWLEEDQSLGGLGLLYRSSRDGLSSSVFHSKCDNKGPTVVIIETTDGGVIGGYTNTAWSSKGSYACADTAFLFALSGFGLSSPCKMKLKRSDSRNAICRSASYGPVFGRGTDLYVSGSMVTLSIGRTYECGPSGQLTAGGSHDIKEMEVFQVNNNPTPLQDPRKKQPISSTSVEKVATVDMFSKKVNRAINIKWTALQELEAEVISLEESFKDEKHFIDSIGSGNSKWLLRCEDPVLAQQFDDSKWAELQVSKEKDSTSSILLDVVARPTSQALASETFVQKLRGAVKADFKTTRATTTMTFPLSRFNSASPSSTHSHRYRITNEILQDNDITVLSANVMSCVFSYISVDEIMRMRCVCTIWRDAAKETFAPFAEIFVNDVASYNAMRAMSNAMPNLQLQQLTLNSLYDGSYSALFNFPFLRKLTIEFSNLKWDLKMLAGLPLLEELKFECNSCLTGNIKSLSGVKNTLRKVDIQASDNVEGNFIVLADFPCLTEVNLLDTAVTGDIRDIELHDFQVIEQLVLPKNVYGGYGYKFYRTSEVATFFQGIYDQLKRFVPLLEGYYWLLSPHSPDWYPGQYGGYPFCAEFVRVSFVEEFGEVAWFNGWRWKSFDCNFGGTCEINWLDPLPEGEIECQWDECAFVYEGFHEPPTQEEYNRLWEEEW